MLKQYIIYERFCIIYNILQLYSTSDSLNEKGLILNWIDSMTLKVWFLTINSNFYIYSEQSRASEDY